MLFAQELAKQACTTAREYMRHAQIDIDQHFGEGFARNNPALVAAYMQTAAADFASTFGMQGIFEAIVRVAEALEEQASSGAARSP